MQWAEVLSADAFSAFEDVGLDNDKVHFFFLFSVRGGILLILLYFTLYGLAFVFDKENPLFSMFNTPY